jgi:hypothetical protein
MEKSKITYYTTMSINCSNLSNQYLEKKDVDLAIFYKNASIGFAIKDNKTVKRKILDENY